MDERSITSQLSWPSDVPLESVASSVSSNTASYLKSSEDVSTDSRHQITSSTLPIVITLSQPETTSFEQLGLTQIDKARGDQISMATGPVGSPTTQAGVCDSPAVPPGNKGAPSAGQALPASPVIVSSIGPHQKESRLRGVFTVQPSPVSVKKKSPTTSPSKLTFGSLLSQRLSGMFTGGEGSKSPASVRSLQLSPRQDVGSCSPMSERSYGSGGAPFPDISHQARDSDVAGSFTSMSSSSSAPGRDGLPENGLSTSGNKDKKSKVNIPGKHLPLPHISKKHGFEREHSRTSQDPSSFRSLFGSITIWRSGSVLSRHLSTGGSNQAINYVTEAQSVIPSLTNAFSIDQLNEFHANHADAPVAMSVFDLDGNQRSVSHQEKLDNVDLLDTLEESEYIDTVKSTDSSSSLLRRSLSVPSRYHYKPPKRHVQDIFSQAQTEYNDVMKDKIGKKLPSTSAVQNEKWRQTMDDLLEHPEYLDSLESTCSKTELLASQARRIIQDQGYGIKPPIAGRSLSTEQQKQLKFIYYKNLIVLSLGFMFIFIAYLSLRNLQSSLYKEDGLGIIALSSIFASLFFGCIFATTIVQRLRPKRTIIVCIAGIFLFVASNFYPRFYTLVPAGAVLGFCLANLWTAHATYLASVASRYAMLSEDKIQNILSQFNGIFFAFFQSSQIIGGLISSTVLRPKSDTASPDETMNNTSLTANYTLMEASVSWNQSWSASVLLDSMDTQLPVQPQCGARYCPAFSDNLPSSSSALDQNLIYILVGIYVACILVGLLVIALCMDPLDGVMKKTHTSMLNQLTAVFRFFGQWKVACLLPLMSYTLMQSSYMYGEYTKAFVTCTSGLYMVGYITVCLCGFSAMSAFVSGRIQRHVGRLPLLCTAFSVHAILLVAQILWQPEPKQTVVMFVIVGFWGLADGILGTQVISLFGVIFADNKEPAFAGLKMCQALSATVLFVTSEYLCTSVKLYVLLVLLMLSASGYLTLEFRLKKTKLLVKFGPTSV